MATELDRAELMAAYAELRQQLAGDPIFTGSEGEEGGTLEKLEQRLERAPETYEEFLAENRGPYRYGGVRLAAQVVRRRGKKAFTHEDALIVDREEIAYYPGDLRVRGDLVLGDRAAVLVAGDLTIDGNFVGAEWDHSLLAVGGSLTVGNVMTHGELVVGERITVKDVAYLHGGELVARAPAIRARTLIENDCINLFGEVEAKERLAEAVGEEDTVGLQRICGLVGMKNVTDIDHFEERFRKRLTAKVPADLRPS